jgi:methyltransferase (TIGR00027 family)
MARAHETTTGCPLFSDPFAELFLDAATERGWQQPPPYMVERIRSIGGYAASRTKWFDEFFIAAGANGIDQAVILAAGLDARGWRLPWVDGTELYEIDQPKVLEYKSSTLAEHGVVPSAERHEVPMDLRFDWPKALRQAGFDASQPTAWLAEGLLMYLPGEAQDRLFEQITELSAPGSRVAAETAGVTSAERREEMRERFAHVAERFGMESVMNIQELMYDDPTRANVTDWLNGHGWTATGLQSADEMRRLDRWALPAEDPDDEAFATFVVAEQG